MKKPIVTSVLLLLYVELLPYLCRLPRGVEWAKQYLPLKINFSSGYSSFLPLRLQRRSH